MEGSNPIYHARESFFCRYTFNPCTCQQLYNLYEVPRMNASRPMHVTSDTYEQHSSYFITEVGVDLGGTLRNAVEQRVKQKQLIANNC